MNEMEESVMAERTKRDKIKEHLRENKKFYIGAGIGASIATLATAALMNRGDVVGSFNIMWKSMIVNNFVKVEKHGGFSWETRCIETGEKTLSQAAMAKMKGISESNLSKHLRGALENINGEHFEHTAISN